MWCGENLKINGVKLSLHPAGQIVGSAQVRLEYKGFCDGNFLEIIKFKMMEFYTF